MCKPLIYGQIQVFKKCSLLYKLGMQLNRQIDFKTLKIPELFEAVEKEWLLLERLDHYFSTFNNWKIESPIPESVSVVNSSSIFIGKGVVIEPFSQIIGPCIIQDGVRIGHGALVRPHTILGFNAQIGHASEVKGSIIFPNAKLAHFNYVGDSLIGCSVNMGAGSICANVRLDEGEVRIRGERTGRKKVGAIIGDGAKIGCQVVLNPGSVIPKLSMVYVKQQLEILSEV